MMSCNSNAVANRIVFETFFQGWLIRQKNYLDQLISTQRNFQNITEHDLRSLVSQVLPHYQQYYSVKAAAAHEDVYIMFAPPWLSSYELTYLSLTGFKPSLDFQILNKSVTQDELTDEQREVLCRLRVETRAAETERNNEMAGLQESWALPPLVNLALRNIPSGGRDNGGTVDAAMQMAEVMETLVEKADFFRMTTTRKIVETLSPVHGVRFLATVTRFQVSIRTLGWQREAAGR